MLRIKLQKDYIKFSSRELMIDHINELGELCFNSKFVGRLDQEKECIKLYSYQKIRAKKIRNTEGKYIVQSPSHWILCITKFPTYLLQHMDKGKMIKQHPSYWSIINIE